MGKEIEPFSSGGAPTAWRTGRRRGRPPACPGTGARNSGPRPRERSGNPPPGRSAGGNGGTGRRILGFHIFLAFNLIILDTYFIIEVKV